MAYWLTPPSRAVFLISVFLALLALLVRYAHIAIPVVSTYPFETLLVGHGEPIEGGASAMVAALGAGAAPSASAAA